MEQKTIDQLRTELSLKAKNGIDFISAATMIWSVITFVWTLPVTSYNRSVLTFVVGGLMLPLALLFSKIFRTTWKLPANPLQPLGLWLNFAQLLYFPFLVFVLLRMPDYFIMTFAIITGAHFFPYGWFYNSKAYAVMAFFISVGSLTLGLILSPDLMYWIPAFMVVALIILGSLLWIDYSSRNRIQV
ncbi:MAG: hypothetical protein JST14_10090 [Bacteroidetes bacterium]|nr:hypothetical protein [Bacteroidota bacterium]